MIELLKGSWTEFLEQLKPLIIVTGPWILAVVGLGAVSTVLGEKVSGLVLFLFLVIELILQAMIAFAGLQLLFKNRGVYIEVNPKKIIIYIVATTYIGIAAALGMVFFIIPGLIIMAASFFAPIYILKENQGPLEAVASSAALLQGKILHVTILLCGVWLAVYAVEYAAGFILDLVPLPEVLVSTVTTAMLIVVGLVVLPIMVNLQMYLLAERNKEVQLAPDDAG